MPRVIAHDQMKSLLAQRMSDQVVDLLTIEHPNLSTPIRKCNDIQSITSNAEIFGAWGFKSDPPNDAEDQEPSARVSMSNVNQEVAEKLKQLPAGDQLLTMTLGAVMRSAPNVDIVSPAKFTVFNFQITVAAITFDLQLEHLGNGQEPIPKQRFVPSTNPAMF